jgi:phosphonate transport system substrate-binding protein
MSQRLSAIFTGIMLLILFCLLLAGCNQQEVSVANPQPKAELQKLTIGLIPEQSIFTQKKRYKPLFEYLSKKLGVTIESKILPRYGNIVNNFKGLGLDGAFFGSFTAAMAIKQLGVVPLATPQHINGSSTYYGLVFVKKGSGIRTAKDLRNKRMVFVDRATTAGYLLPLAYFKSIGINDYKKWFKEYYFSGTHEGAVNDVLNGSADIGAAKNTVLYRMAEQDERVLKGLEILATSPLVPANGLAVRRDFPENLKTALKQELLNIHQNAEGRFVLESLQANKFIETSAKDYLPVLDYAASIGLDLNAYIYQNK